LIQLKVAEYVSVCVCVSVCVAVQLSMAANQPVQTVNLSYFSVYFITVQ